MSDPVRPPIHPDVLKLQAQRTQLKPRMDTRQIKGSVHITNVAVPECEVCGEIAHYRVVYFRDNDAKRERGEMHYGCIWDHVVEVTRRIGQ